MSLPCWKTSARKKEKQEEKGERKEKKISNYVVNDSDEHLIANIY